MAATFATAIRSELEMDLKPEDNQRRKDEHQIASGENPTGIEGL